MYVYETTNLINGKKYIGVSVTTDRIKSEKYLGSGIMLLRAIKKYGVDNFKKRIIKEFDNENEARNYERYLINELGAIGDDNYYNLVAGGYGGGVRNHPVSDETRRKISESKKGRPANKNQIIESSRKTLQYDLDGNFIREFNSKSTAENELGIDISRLCIMDIAHHNGYLWKYKDGEIELKVTPYSEIEKRRKIEVSKKIGKLSREEVISLKKDRDIGFSYEKLSSKYGITKSCAYEIVIGKTYKWV